MEAVLPGLDTGEVREVNKCLRDIVALSTLPAIWYGAEPLRIAESLAASLFTMLNPEFVYISFAEDRGGPSIAIAQTGRYRSSPELAERLGADILEWARTHDPEDLLLVPSPSAAGSVRVTARALGHHAELGVIAAGFAAEGAPTSAHHLMLSVGATQAASAIQNSLLLRSLRESEEALRQLTGVLEERVVERTRQLTNEIAERGKAEAALRQAQKMEAVGQLTGGVAHDFNNLLTVIAGNLEFLETQAEADGAVRRVVDAAQRAVGRGARLTQQLLAFARRQALRPEIIDLGDVVTEGEGLLRRAVGEAIEVAILADPDIWPCRIDPAQFENAILNLAVNARDAMPTGGRLTIAVRNVELDDDNGLDATPGPYVLVSVADTGQGMAPELLDRAFEPFFTTKEVGKGTGLGLSQVYGFVKQSDGHVRIESEVGAGTAVMIYLPKVPGTILGPGGPDGRRTEPPQGSETILLVEDNPDVLDVTAAALEALGYHVLAAQNGPEALAVLERGEPIDLLFTDLVMPQGISGGELARRARQMRPELKVLLASGYAAGTAPVAAVADLPILAKPYRRVELAEKIRAALARG